MTSAKQAGPERSLACGSSGVLGAGAAVSLQVELPAWVRSAVRRTDVDVLVLINAPGADVPLEPSLAFDFGAHTHGPLLRWPIHGAEAMAGGVKIRLPRGLKSLHVHPHVGPFAARDFSCRLARIHPEVHAGERVIFAVAHGIEAGIGALRTSEQRADASLRIARNVAMDTVSGVFRALTFDPHMEFDLAEPLQKGWWRIEADMAGPDASRPRLYVADGDGLFEHHSAELTLRDGGRFVGFVCLYDESSWIRFDPTHRSGEAGNLQRLSMRPASQTEIGREALRPSVWAATRKVRGTRALIRRLLDPSAEEGHWPLPVRMPIERDELIQSGDAYQYWIERHDYAGRTDDAAYREGLRAAAARPKISIVMPVYKTPIKLLDEAVRSVRDQIYTDWELCIADDASGDAALEARLSYWAKSDSRIKVTVRETNGNISAASNDAFALASGEWVVLLDHDDLLRPFALAELVLTLNTRPDAQIVYSDEDKINEQGERYAPYFKPDFSPFLFYGQNYLNHLTAHRSDNIRKVGGWREGFEGSQDYDLTLRILEHVNPSDVVHIPKILYHWRAISGSTAVAVGEKSYAWEAGLRALEEHFQRRGLDVSVGSVEGYPYYAVDWPIPDPAPLVSLIIPTRDRGALVEMCVNSVLDLSTYQNYEIIIVDNQSSDPETFAIFDRLKAKDRRVSVLKYSEEFNFSAINNFAVEQARGEIVGLVNNDIEVISPDWLENMVSLAIQDTVGCVGAMLYYPDDRIQHAGVVIGIGGVAGHSHKYAERGAQGYFARLKLVHDVSAVTAACLLVRKSVYDEVGGLNEEHLTIAFNDVDLCLKVQEAGYRNVFTPRAELYHHESISRGHEDTNEKRVRFQREVEYMLKRWATDTRADPYYSPNLTLKYEDFRIRED